MNTRTLRTTSEVTAEDVVILVNDTQEMSYDKPYNWQNNKIAICNKENKIITYLNLIVKRTVDIIGGLIGIAILIPLTVIVTIVNFMNKDFGPTFYSHKRIGKNGKYFKMYKFRTMMVNSDEKLEEILRNDENARKEWEENRKLKNDPRVTKIGKILRKTSLDEWPQFLNVFLGEMSIVGPRAVVDGEIEKFGMYKNDILEVKPGITGYWAANGRSDTTYEERVFMEHKYIREFSLLMDIKILLQTVVSVIKKKGAV